MKMVRHILIFISFYLLMQSDEVSTNKHIYVNTTYVGCSVLNSYVGYGPFVFANSSVGYFCKFVAECKIRSPILLLQCHISFFCPLCSEYMSFIPWNFMHMTCTNCIYTIISVIRLVVLVSLFALLVISR